MFLKNVKWDITNRCFLNCSFCINANQRKGEFSKGDISLEEKFNIIDKLSESGVEHIQLLGGEPLYSKSFFEVIDYAASKGLMIGINTNGVMLTDKNIHRLIDTHAVDDIIISLDGLEKTHDKIRGAKIANMVFDNIANLVSLRNEKKMSFSIGVNTVITKENISELVPLIQKLDNIGIDRWYGLELIEYSADNGTFNLVYTVDEILNLLKTLGELQKDIKTVIVPSFAAPFIVAYANKLNNCDLTIPTHFCGAGLTFAYIDWSGKIYPCDRAVPSKLNVDCYEGLEKKEYYLQNESLQDCFSSKLFKNFSFLYADEDIVPSACYGCTFHKKVCNPCLATIRNGASRNCCIACLEVKKRIANEYAIQLSGDGEYYYIPKHVIYHRNRNTNYLFDIQSDEIYEIDNVIMDAILIALYENERKLKSELITEVFLSDKIKFDFLSGDAMELIERFTEQFNELQKENIICIG